MAEHLPREDEPCYVISVAARMVNLHPQTLRYIERMGLIAPTRTRGNIRLYSPQEIKRLRSIVRLTDELGVNLAGVEVILSMARKMEEMREEMERMEAEFEKEIERLRSRLQEMGASS